MVSRLPSLVKLANPLATTSPVVRPPIPVEAFQPGDAAKHQALKKILGVSLLAGGTGALWQTGLGIRDFIARHGKPPEGGASRQVPIHLPYVDPDDENADGIVDKLQRQRKLADDVKFPTGYEGHNDLLGGAATQVGKGMGLFRQQSPKGWDWARENFYTANETNPAAMPWVYPAAFLGAYGAFNLGNWGSKTIQRAMREKELETERDEVERQFRDAVKQGEQPDGIDRLYALTKRGETPNIPPFYRQAVVGPAALVGSILLAHSLNQGFKESRNNSEAAMIREALKERQSKREMESPTPVVVLPEKMETEEERQKRMQEEATWAHIKERAGHYGQQFGEGAQYAGGKAWEGLSYLGEQGGRLGKQIGSSLGEAWDSTKGRLGSLTGHA